MAGGMVAQQLTPDLVVLEAHRACRPYALRKQKDAFIEVNSKLPRDCATMYLQWQGEWRLRPLNGIASAPLLHDDGTIHHAEGYDTETGVWCEAVPDLTGLLKERPTESDAKAALLLLRDTFKTFCFADAETVRDVGSGIEVVDTRKNPGKDESGFLVALLTAVCRPSLDLAPGVLLRGAQMSGAGTGKGLLSRCMCLIANGREPHAVTTGGDAVELEKRIVAELLAASPTLFLDNMNGVSFKSATLASAITERPARVRELGKSRNLPINSAALVILTGNALSMSEDLVRRFIDIILDARTEDPEARAFVGDIRAEIKCRRAELLAACLTIWRWGRQASHLKPGRALGSFGRWSMWCRDPLLALGCTDPAERVSEAKQRDPRRQVIGDLFVAWWQHHDTTPIAARDLHDSVRQLADPQGRGRQYLSAALDKLASTRAAGFALTRQAPAGKWGCATYKLEDHGGAEVLRRQQEGETPPPPTTAEGWI